MGRARLVACSSPQSWQKRSWYSGFPNLAHESKQLRQSGRSKASGMIVAQRMQNPSLSRGCVDFALPFDDFFVLVALFEPELRVLAVDGVADTTDGRF